MVAGNMILARMLMPFEHSVGTTGANGPTRWRPGAGWARCSSSRCRTATPTPCPRPRGTWWSSAWLHAARRRPAGAARHLASPSQPGEMHRHHRPSASGKSTLLRLSLGMVQPTTGGVFLDGTSTYLWNREDFARHVGYVPQRPALLDGPSPRTSPACAAGPGAVIAAAKRAGVHAILPPCRTATPPASSASILSGGQRQRVALARALYGRRACSSSMSRTPFSTRRARPS